MTRDERERLDDIWEAIQRIRKMMSSGPQTLEAEAIARDATLYNLVIIGEATKHLGEDPKARHPEIPWRRIAGLRDLSRTRTSGSRWPPSARSSTATLGPWSGRSRISAVRKRMWPSLEAIRTAPTSITTSRSTWRGSGERWSAT